MVEEDLEDLPEWDMFADIPDGVGEKKFTSNGFIICCFGVLFVLLTSTLLLLPKTEVPWLEFEEVPFTLSSSVFDSAVFFGSVFIVVLRYLNVGELLNEVLDKFDFLLAIDVIVYFVHLI